MNEPEKTGPLDWAERYARLLDSSIRVPGTNFSFGLDPILGLIPGLGDAVSFVFQFLLAISLIRHGVSGRLSALLFINVFLDTIIGSIPLIGQIWDFFFKANERNLRLVKEYVYEEKHRGSGGRLWLSFFLLLLLTIVAIIYAIIWSIKWLIQLFQ